VDICLLEGAISSKCVLDAGGGMADGSGHDTHVVRWISFVAHLSEPASELGGCAEGRYAVALHQSRDGGRTDTRPFRQVSLGHPPGLESIA
jgi:hypothetical protein